ncbi:unnamed protein product [Caenorhabditis nigoni]
MTVLVLKMMGYAYACLTDQQKNDITSITSKIESGKISLTLRCNSSAEGINITYETFRSNTTNVKIENSALDPIQLDFVDVFLDDLEIMLKNQKTVLSPFALNCLKGTAEDGEKICERIQTILKSRKVALAVQSVRFDGITAAQTISIMRLLDKGKLLPEFLESYFPDGAPLRGTTKEESDKSLTETVQRTVFENSLPMKFILRHLQCFDIERLRKVNRRIRECVDLTKPNPHIKKFSITFVREKYLLDATLYTRIALENRRFRRCDVFHLRIQNIC